MNRKMKKRLLSLLLCLVMLFGLIPISTYAAEEEIINPVSATITLPTAGSHPIETGTPGGSSYTITRVRFYDGSEQLDISDTFEAGKTYQISVSFRPNSGFAIGRTASATINGIEATWWNTLGDGWGTTIFHINYTVPEEITSLSVTVPTPAAGEAPDTIGITIGTTGIRINSAQWYAYKKDVGYMPVNKFTAGGTYTLLIKYDIADGYTVSGGAAILHDLTGGKAEHNSSAKTIMIEYKVPQTYTVTVENDGNGTAQASVTKAEKDTIVTLTAVPKEGYEFDRWEIISGSVTPEDVGAETTTFTMPVGAVTVKAIFKEIISEVEPTAITSVKISDVTEPVIGAAPDWDITITGEGAIINETIDVSWYKCDPESDEWEPLEDEDTPFGPGLYRLEVYLCAEDGYEFTDATKFYFDEEALPAWDGGYDSSYYWWGVGGYAAIFLYLTPEEPLTPPETETPEREKVTAVFDDVYDVWYTEYVQYVYDNGLMTGIKGTKHFAPNDNITKAQVAQVLYNMEGKPVAADRSVFTELKDVYETEWYADAVSWAYSTGVVTGDLDAKKFSPNADVTREQLALMMYRYAKYKGYDTSKTSDFEGMTGAEKIADWAKDGVTWAVGAGLISGIEMNGVKDIAPQGNASRAQVAAILQRFCENVKR